MKEQVNQAGNLITNKASQFVAELLETTQDKLQVKGVSGGYSRNRRALVGSGDKWIFVKEVDTDLLPSEGEEELWWLRKDSLCVNTLKNYTPELVADWVKLSGDGNVLVMPGYREEDGWLWSLPQDIELQNRYVDAVIGATKKLEDLKFDGETIDNLKLNPFFRDEIAFDYGIEQVLKDQSVREQLQGKYTKLINRSDIHKSKYELMLQLLNSDKLLNELLESTRVLAKQPNDAFGHCDVRSDNLAFNSKTGVVKFVDWNWASFTPRGFGATEFLIDMSRRGVDITPWVHSLNTGLLAGTVGYYAIRSLKEPLMPGNTLREVQAESAAISYDLYRHISRLV